jgi:hypothetical protein
MATPGELVRSMAAAFGVSEATVAVHDRNLAIAGLRTKLGRGTSAAQMTPRDAANLTVAIMGSAEVRDSVIAVKRYSATRASAPEPVKYEGRKSSIPQIPELNALREGHSFTDSLEAIYTAATTGSLQRAFEKQLEGSPDRKHHYSWTQLQIEAHAPGALAGIRLWGIRSDSVTWKYALPSKPQSAHIELLRELGLDQHSGMKQMRYIMGDVIFRVGLALLPKADSDEGLKTKASQLAECS